MAGTHRLPAAGAMLFGLLASGLMARSTAIGRDYLVARCQISVCDDAAPQINALIAGDLPAFFSLQAPMGPVSLLLRAPFAALGQSELTRYRLGAFICLLALALLAVHVGLTMARRGRSWMAWTVIPAALLVNPLTYNALTFGHPEEALTAALCVGAVLVAPRRATGAAVLLGCAIATKQWALMALIPALIVAPAAGRIRLGAVTVLLAGALIAPMAIGDLDRFLAAQSAVGLGVDVSGTVTPSNVWWPFAATVAQQVQTPQGIAYDLSFVLPSAVGEASRLIIIALAIGLALLYARRRSDGQPEDVLCLLALILLVRCIFDPVNFSYHHLPFLVALLAWEGLRRRVPVASAIAIAAVLALQYVIVPMGSGWRINAFYLAWAIPTAVYLGVQTFSPALVERVSARVAAATRA
jgi:hypothetical protein